MDNVIDIKTRRKEKFSPSYWHMTQQLILAEGVTEVVAMIRDICGEFPDMNPMPSIPHQPGLNDEVSEVLRKATNELEGIEDRVLNRGASA
jgi:hypothetical protein